MIKRFALKKIAVYSLCLVLILLFYFLPTHETIKEDKVINYGKENIVYLLDSDNYVSRVISYFDENTIEGEIKKKIDILKKGDINLKEFKPLIPNNVIVNSIKIDKNDVYIDFNKEFLNIKSYEKTLEALIFSLTEINGIDNIYISVDNNKLTNIDNNEIPYPLTRSYGINKEYDLNSLININKTIVYFSKNDYYVPVTKINNDKESKIEIIIKELKSSVNSQNNLESKIDNDLELISYKIDEGTILLTFNKKVNNDIKELINKSIKENYIVDEIIYEVKK